MLTPLGKKVRLLRKRSGLTLKALGEKVGRGESHIWHLENRTRKPSAEQIQQLAEVLGTTVEYLLSVEDDEKSASDAAFFTKYKTADRRCKTRLRHIFDVLLASERP